MPHFVGRLAYDGTHYAGFQRQAESPTVQAAVEAALAIIAGQSVSCIGAGRTDAGVHASGQIISWKMAWSHSTPRLLKALNNYLPPDIALHNIALVEDDFHPRFDAICRTYLYKLYTGSVRDPFRNRFTWHCFYTLAPEMMAQAAQLLIGTHDFATFGQPPKGTNTVRTVQQLDVIRVNHEIHFTISADAFLKRMVRSIIGTLVEVGRGKMTINDFEKAFKAADRSQAGTTAPAHGLILTDVTYKHPLFKKEKTHE